MLFPPRMIMSLMRPEMYTKPWASRYARSAVRNQPSSVQGGALPPSASVGAIGWRTEPSRLDASSWGIVMNAGPASVSPYELITDAWGIRACSLLKVAGASGALPIETAIGAE